MNLFDQIRKISFVFFVIIGLAHFLAGLMYINGYWPSTSSLVNRVLFIPFVVATLTYALSNLRCQLLEHSKNSKIWDYVFLIFGITVFIIILSIEFLVSDSPSPLVP